MTGLRLPTDANDLTPDDLNLVLAPAGGQLIADFEVVEVHLWGEGHASSAGRIVIEPVYGAAAPAGLPKRLVVKVAKTDPSSDDPKQVRGTGALYRNEVDIYTRLEPSSFLEAPRVLGGRYESETSTFLLVMEDLRERGASFGSVTRPVSLEGVQSLLAALAKLHARYWQSSELTGALSWMEAHTRGDLHRVFNTPEAAPRFIAHQVETEQFKREMVQGIGETVDSLFAGFQRLQRHQATLPQTVCHGDCHIANTYFLSDGRGGLLDWQLASQGYAMHDVSYLIATALSVAERRRNEGELLAYYRDRLQAEGALAPSAEDLWLEYRRALVWGVYIGWLTTPVVNYGWEVTVMNHLRLMTAYQDLETRKALDAIG